MLPQYSLDGKGNPTKTYQQRDVKLENASKHMVKLYVKNPVSGKLVYPFVQHERVSVWLQSMPERR